jgi:hypothetical protein
MDSYFSLTAAPSRSTLQLFQKGVLHLELPIAPLEFPQPSTFRQFQWRLVGSVRLTIIPNPATQGSLAHADFSPHLRDRAIILDYQAGSFFAELR